MFRTALLLSCLVAPMGCADIIEFEEVTVPNQPPDVAITFPAAGARVNRVITVSADASDLEGAIASVTFDLPDGTRITDAAPPFSATWDSTRVADGGHEILATAIDLDGETTTTSTRVAVANGSCLPRTFPAPLTSPVRIPDNGGLVSSIAVAGAGSVTQLAVSLSISHDYPADLVVTLVSPEGTELDLSTPAAPRLNINGQATYAFQGEQAAGAWRLYVDDLEVEDVGWLNDWSLSFAGSCGLTAMTAVTAP